MKKLLILCISVLFTNFLMAQNATIAVNSTGIAEVGIPQNFQLTLNPMASAGNTHYRIDDWLIIAYIGNGGTISGNINGQSIPNYYFTPPLNQINSISNGRTINIPITYGSNAPDSDNVEVQASGFYGKLDAQGNFVATNAFFAKYTKSNGSAGYAVDVKIVCPPTISNPAILDCCTSNIQICASNYCDASKFSWNVTNATIFSGQGTNCITITPANIGNVTANCTVSRTTGLPNYTAMGNNSISRTPRSISLSTSNSAYICAGSSRIMQTDNQCGQTGINWTGHNCTISPETIVNGKRQVTVTANSNLTSANGITVYAASSFSGGCTATTSLLIPVGSPRTTLPEATCYTTNAPCAITATANYNYLHFTLNSPLGNYTPQYGDWQWEKISGNFYFLSNTTGQYNGTSRFSPDANLYLTGANPTDNPLKFRARVKAECDWGPWNEYVWNDGTTTVITPLAPPEKYYNIYPNPSSGYAANITLLNSSIVPTTNSLPVVKLYSIYGELLQTSQMYTTSYGAVYIYQFPYNIMWISISFDNHTETHTIYKY